MSVACETPLTDLIRTLPGYDPYRGADDYWFDEEAAQLKVDFFPAMLKHVKGEFAGQPFELMPWQAAVIANLFGWKDSAGLRRYREALLYVPRKMGKTTLCGGIVNVMLFCDGEPGAEIYGAACEYKQASLVFDQAYGMVRQEPMLASRCKVFKGQVKCIELHSDRSIYRVISGEPDTAWGFNTHCAVIDELHTLPNDKLVAALTTSTGARRQPLIVSITTADVLRESICNTKYDYACGVRDGRINDPTFLPVIYEATRDDDWTDETTWAKANPNLGVTVDVDFYRKECAKAKASPGYENDFKRLYLNMRTEQAVRWIKKDVWDSNFRKFTAAEMLGRTCYAGLDLGSTKDLTALVLLFPGDDDEFRLLPWFWCPRAEVVKRANRGDRLYELAEEAGMLTVTESPTVDYALIGQTIVDIANTHGLAGIAVDRLFQGDYLIQTLRDNGIECTPWGQGYVSMAGPSSMFEKLLAEGKLHHNGNKLLEWMAANVAVMTDPKSTADERTIKPVKTSRENKIDGIVAAIMAIGLYGKSDTGCPYESRGVFTIDPYADDR